MTSFKSKAGFTLLILSAWFSPAPAQENYLVPPVQLLPLKKMETNSYGLEIADSASPLNSDAWAKSAFPVVAGKINALSAPLPAAAEKLKHDLLVLTAEAPQLTPDQAFITLRLATLFKNGYFDDVNQLIQKIPETKRSDEQSDIYTKMLLLNNFSIGCLQTAKTTDTLFRLQTALICAAYENRDDDAFFLQNMLKEQGSEDPFIADAAEFMLRKKKITSKPAETTPLTTAIWKAVGKSTAELDFIAEPWFEKIFVADENVPDRAKLPVMEKLVQNGLTAPAKLRILYQRVHVEKPSDGSERRAFLVQRAADLISTPQDNLKKHELIKEAFSSARADGVTYAFSAAIKDILSTLKEDADTLANCPEIIHALALAGMTDDANRWYQKAVLTYPVSETTAESWTVNAIGGLNKEDVFMIPSLENMMSYQDKEKKFNPKKVDRIVLLLKTMGLTLPEEAWEYTTFLSGSAEKAFLERNDNEKITRVKSNGEKVLNALEALNNGYVGLLECVKILTETGLTDDARKIAIQSFGIVDRTDG